MLHVALNGYPYNGPLRLALTRNGGIWPATNQTLAEWSRHMQHEVLPAMDIMIDWYSPHIEGPVMDAWAPQARRLIGLESLDPWISEQAWTTLFGPETHIIVVSPFAVSIQHQISRLPNIFPYPIWSQPCPRFHCVRSGCSPALDTKGIAAWPPHILAGGWRAAVNHLVSEATACLPSTIPPQGHVAIVGCGAISLPVVAALKKRGMIAIHMGGATQCMFGIRGRRWRDHAILGKLQVATNPYWVNPRAEETPANSKQIEGGCYWEDLVAEEPAA